jgi:chaperonin GroEL (HSP60 family)
MRYETGSFGLDAAKGEYVDLVTAGIIDPTKVVLDGARKCCLRGRRALVD